MTQPIIAITMGDPNGIGPELIVKVLAQAWPWEVCRPFVIGHPGIMQDICRVVGADLRFRPIGHPSEAAFSPPTVEVLHPEELEVEHAV